MTIRQFGGALKAQVVDRFAQGLEEVKVSLT